MNLTLKEQLRLQKQAGIITESQYQKKLSEFIQRSGRSYKDYQLTITNKNTKKEITFDIDSKPTTMTGKWDADDVIEIFQDNYIKPEGTVILTLRDSHGKILKMGNIVGFQDGKDMIINDLPITQDLKEFEKKTTKLSDKEQAIVDDLLNSLNENAFSNMVDKIKSYAKRGMLTIGIISAVLGSPSITAAQRDYLRNEPAIETVMNSSSNSIETSSNAKQELANQYNWWLSYLQSPQYLQRLQKEFPNKDKKWIENERDTRLNNLKSVKTKTQFVDAIGKEPGFSLGVYIPKKYEGERWDYNLQKWVKPQHTTDKKGYDKQGHAYFEKNFDPGYETIPAHELGHAVDDAGYRIPKETKEKIYKYTKGGGDYKDYKSGNMEFDYYTTPTEFINRLQPVRYLLQKEKIYDANTKDFSEQDYNKMINNPKIQNNEHFKDIMNSLKGSNQEKKKNFIDLMNTIASNNIKMPTQQDISNLA